MQVKKKKPRLRLEENIKKRDKEREIREVEEITKHIARKHALGEDKQNK